MQITTSGPNYIELLGMFGDFETPGSDYIIHYFSTFANNRNKGDFYHQLLEELMPMRERLDLDKIDDLSTLLQRDLNDLRVAGDLVPYLKNQLQDPKHIAFFPAILGVLIPEDFVNKNEENALYPKCTKVSDTEYHYGEDWKIEYFSDSKGTATSLGKLMINLINTDIVVIDGQHRANAFRVLAQTFNKSNNKKQGVYDVFYGEIEVPETFSADLPVTLIWFESKKEESPIKPNLISRQLFVDVNNSAKRVNQSRTILLNDKDPSSVITRLFYSKIAKEEKFKANRFSLLHSGFDVDTGLKNSTPHIFTLTTPELMNYVFDWFFFGKRDYNELDRDRVGSRIKRQENEPFSMYIGNPSAYIEYGTDIDDDYYKRIKGDANLSSLQSNFEEKSLNAFLHVFNKFILLRTHYDACEVIQGYHESKTVTDNWSLTESDAWRHLFLGGEGLYYVFKSIDNPKGQAQSFKTAASEISKKFSTIRASLAHYDTAKDVDDAFKSFRSFALQVGLFMALDYHYRKNGRFNSLMEAAEDFVTRLNNYSVKDWIYILTKIRGEYIGNVDPKVWPAYQNMFIRLIQTNDEYYNLNDNRNNSPDAVIFREFFIQRCRSYAKKKFRANLKDIYLKEIKNEISDFISEAKCDLEELFEPIIGQQNNFGVLDIDFNNIANNAINTIVKHEQE